MRDTLRAFLRILALLVVALVVLQFAVQLFLASPRGQRFVEARLHGLVSQALAPGWTFRRAHVTWRLGGHLILEDVLLADPEGDPAVAVARADLELGLLRLLIGTVYVESARVSGVTVNLETDDEGLLNVARAFGATVQPQPEPTPWEGLPFRLVVDDLGLRDAHVVFRVPDEQDRTRPVVAVKVTTLSAARVVLPRGRPAVEVTGLDLGAVLLEPGPLPLIVTGGGAWTPDGVRADDLRVVTTDTRLSLDGRLDDLHGRGSGDATLVLAPLSFRTIRDLTGVPLQGAFEGSLTASGPLTALELRGGLRGIEGTVGRIALREGTRLCLPVVDGAVDRCAEPFEGTGDPLPTFGPGDLPRWRVALDVENLDVEAVAPVVGGPLRLDTALRVRGRGFAFPADLVAEGHLEGKELHILPVHFYDHAADVRLEDGVLHIPSIAVTGVVGTLEGSGRLDLTPGGPGTLEVTAAGSLDLSLLDEFGTEGFRGGGTVRASLEGRLFEDGAPIRVVGTVDAVDVGFQDIVEVGTLVGPLEVSIRDGAFGFASRGLDLTAVRAQDTTAAALHAEGLGVSVASGGLPVGVTVAEVRLDDFEGFGIATRAATVHGVDVTVPESGPVVVEAGPTDVEGFSGFEITAEEAQIAGARVEAGTDGSVVVLLGEGVMQRVVAYGIEAEQAAVASLEVLVAGGGGPVDVTLGGTELGGASAYGIEAGRATLPGLEVDVAPGGAADVRVPGAVLEDVEAYGVRAREADVAELEVTAPGPGEPVGVEVEGATLESVEAGGVTAGGADVGATEVRVRPGGPTSVEVTGATFEDVATGDVTAGGLTVGPTGAEIRPDGPVTVEVERTTAEDVAAGGVTAEGVSVGATEVRTRPGGPTTVEVSGATLGEVATEGVTAGEATVGPTSVEARPGGPTSVQVSGTTVRNVAAGGVTARDLAAGGVEVSVSPAGEVRGEGTGVAVRDVGDGAVEAAGAGRVRVRVETDGSVDVGVSDLGLVGLSMFGATAASGVVEAVRVRVEPSGEAVVEGRATVGRVVYEAADAVVDDVRVGFLVTAPVDGDPVVAVDVRTGPHVVLGLTGDAGEAELVLEGVVLSGDITLRRHGEPWVIADDLRVDTEAMAIGLGHLELRPTWRQTWVSTAPLSLTVGESGIRDADVSLRSEHGALRVQGTFGTEGPLDGRVVLDRLDLDVIAELFPAVAGGLDGVVTLDLVAGGTAEVPTISARIDGEDLFWEDTFRWLDVKGQATLLQDVIDVNVELGVAGRPLARVLGYVPVEGGLSDFAVTPEGEADLRVILHAGRLERLERLVPGLDLPDGRAAGMFRVLGDLRDPDLDVQAVVETPVAGEDDLRFEVLATRRQARLALSLDVYAGFEPIVLVDGSARTRFSEVMAWLLGDGPAPDFDDPSLYVDDVRIGAQVDEAPVPLLLHLADIDVDVTGVLSGEVEVSGDPLRPEIRGGLHGDLGIAGLPADLVLGLEPDPDDVGYRLELSLGREDDVWFDATGRVPLRIDLAAAPEDWAAGSWDLAVAGSGVPLEVLRALDAGIDQPRGRIVMGGTVTGPLWSPDPDLEVTLVDGEVVYLPLGLVFRDFQARATAHPRAGGGLVLAMEQLSVVTRPAGITLGELAQPGESRITGTAEVTLAGIVPTDVRGHLTLQNAWLVSLDDTTLRASGSIDVAGRWPALVVRGNLAVGQGEITLDVARLAQPSAIEVDRSIRVHRAGGVYVTEEADDESWFDDLSLALDLDLGRNTRLALGIPLSEDFGALGASLTRVDVEARLGGQLAATVENGDFSLVGTVEMLDGVVKLLRGRFELQPGSQIAFIGGDMVDAEVSVTALMVVGGGQIGLELTGPLQSPDLEFTQSDFGSDAAVFTILLTGRPPDELTADQGRAALEAAGDLLVQSVLGGFDLGSVSVEGDGTVRFGLPVYRTVFVESTFDPNPQLDENRITVQLEWSILPRLVLQARYGDREVAGQLVYELRFTSLCDRWRDALELIEDRRVVGELGCRAVRRRVRREGGIAALEARSRQLALPSVPEEPPADEAPAGEAPEEVPAGAPGDASDAR